MFCRLTVAKVFNCFFNLLLGLVGLGCTAVGIWLWQDKDFKEITAAVHDGDLFVSSYVLIGVGAAIFLTSFYGLCGAIIESKCILLSYIIIVVVLLVAEIVGVGIIWGKNPYADDLLKLTLQEEFDEYKSNEQSQIFINKLQNRFRCCGIDGEKDYASINKTSPHSCHEIETNLVFPRGCFAAMKPYLGDFLAVTGGLIGGVTACQLFAVIVSVFLYRILRPSAD